MRKLRGVLCPVATPFDYAGELYPAKLRHNLAKLGRTRIAAYVLTSWDGEGSLLSGEEGKRVWDLAIDAAEGRPCIAAPSAESVHEAAALAKAAKAAGCQGVRLRSPADYRGPGDEARAMLFLRSVADRCELPVACAVDARRPLSPTSAAQLAQHPNVAGVLYRGHDAGWMQSFVDAGGVADLLWAGREDHWRQAWELGSRTAELALANVVPFHLLSIEEALRTRDTAAAEELIDRAAGAAEIPSLFGPAGLKAAMDLRGSYGGAPRLPLVAVDVDAKSEIEKRLAGLAS
ncbi:MAG: dihydrodipicolinate synthase family protein [Acidobacteria bacterium]|nr:dihydrodipicolinate synthase family protein [Acidobacteriota bacterium]